MMKLVLSNQNIKKPNILKTPIKKPNTIKPLKPLKKANIHPVNSVLADVVAKKPFKSCGCGK